MISIIVPIYQVREYLVKCVDSILNQTYKDIEIILVDDGSHDGSERICDDYKKKDSRIKVVHKPNGGLVSARKAGLSVAQGDYIGYVDSDDWISEAMYEALLNEMITTDSDVIVCAHYEVQNDSIRKVENYLNAGVYDGEKLQKELFPQMMYVPKNRRWGLSPAAWDKLFKKELVYTNQMLVDDSIWDGEDSAFVYPSMLNARRISILRESYYYHRVRDNSVALAYDSRCFERIGYLFQTLKHQLEKSSNFEAVRSTYPYLIRWYLYKHIRMELRIPDIDKQGQKEWIFPFGKVDKGSRVILYGAGKVGNSFYKQIEKTAYCNVIAWVDKNFEKYDDCILSPHVIGKMAFDVIVIAVENEGVADDIRRDLWQEYGNEVRIVWSSPIL